MMNDSMVEEGRFFLEYGQVKKLIRLYTYKEDEYSWCLKKTAGYPYIEVQQGETYPGYDRMIEESSLKYCPLKKLMNVDSNFWGWGKPDVARIDSLMAYANNPAIEMYCKMNMYKLTHRLEIKESMYGPVNRRKDTMKGQLRLQKKENINKLVKENGDPELLELLQYEEKMGYSWKPEWEKQLCRIWSKDNKKRIEEMLRYMTMQQLLNRIEKYEAQLYGEEKYFRSYEETFLKYSDYL